MRGVFDEDLEMPRTERDTELTLGNGLLLLLFFGLVLLCGLCFGLGYSVGHRSVQQGTANQQPAVGTASVETSGSAAKPSATTQAAAPQPAPSDVQPSEDAQPSATGATAAAAQSAQSQTASSPQVRPALPAAQASASPASNARQVGATPLTVQIAAVSHQEDADVLVGALRKRGYAVSAHREGSDSLIHVRIGPFKSRDEANRWRSKLLNDGYNAIIQP
jgi:DedD protein